ncbi:type II toxin-antitoxin system HicB family antitoxin [Devosia sp. PTR5]|uniref:Type II toxin-antitoxin system HicB family antitoxin n=1 Tax=Devosia oryzisoli TaxID=2774138 RepID=A0A927IR35_9HYPH|nr:type II toxin-antitoxin system HicB family antitoxin [Devosia oryzisoli]MBD8066285.1 type II toxin-antitoxin system HicB family antitoxin [Devosia oryzisoli]
MRDVHYIALIHKDPEPGYGVSFPDVPGVIAVADTMDEAIAEAAAVLAIAFEDWPDEQPVPRTLEALRQDARFQNDAEGAVVAVIRPSPKYYQAAE